MFFSCFNRVALPRVRIGARTASIAAWSCTYRFWFESPDGFEFAVSELWSDFTYFVLGDQSSPAERFYTGALDLGAADSDYSFLDI